MKNLHIIIGIVFIIFAILQYNDPDYYIWIPVYSLISFIAFSTAASAGSMKAETPHIELMRELFGLIISLVATIYYATKK